MTPEDIAETVYIRLSETDDRGEHIRIIADVLCKTEGRGLEKAARECTMLELVALGQYQDTLRQVHAARADAFRQAATAIRTLGTEGE